MERGKETVFLISVIGQTVGERNALFNRCHFATVFRDCDYMGRTEWHLLVGTDHTGGFRHGEFKTRKEAIAFAKERYPGLQIAAQWGDEMRPIQEMAEPVRKIHAIEGSNNA